jgi:endonuclease YncB( thermonuclease family)
MKTSLRLLLLVIALYSLTPVPPAFSQEPVIPPDRKVLRVFDGDTLLVSPGEKVRLIGIDTMETHEGEKLTRQARIYKLKEKEIKKQGNKSKKIVGKLLKGKWVRLAPGREAKDAYGRTLAYVYFTIREDKLLKAVGQKFPEGRPPGEKEFMLNRVMVQYGWAEAMRRYPFDYLEEFSELQAVAKQNRWGIWKKLIRSEPL